MSRDMLGRSWWSWGRRLAVVLGGVGLASVLGFEYALGQAVFVATYAIAGLGVVLIVGQSGQVSLGQGALLALGAYAQAVATLRGVPAPLALLLAIAVGALGGAVASLPARRLGGLYFAMSTLAFALIVEESLVRLEDITRGAAGLVVPAFTVGSWRADTPLASFAVSALMWAVALACCVCWCRSQVGRAWRAIRDNEAAAAACGINPQRAKLQVFVIGGGLSGLAGALYAHWIGFISPEQFGLLLSFELLMLAFIGGVQRLSGALWGALVIVALPQLIAVLRDHLPPALAQAAGLEAALFGAVLVAVVVWRPQGIAGGQSQEGVPPHGSKSGMP